MKINMTSPARGVSVNLDAAFRPRGIAIAESTGSGTEPGHQVLCNLLEAGYPGHVAIISPTQTSAVLGVPAYQALDQVPGPVELLVLAAPAETTPEMVQAIGLRAGVRKDLKVVVALGGGFGEAGSTDGGQWQNQLAEGCRAACVRLIGPDCLGIVDNKNRLDTTRLTGICRRPGGVSLLSQSGAMGAWMAMELGALPMPVGLSKLISLGNMADVDMADMLEYLGKDPSTKAVGLCLEGSPAGGGLLETAGRVTANKPVLVLSVGHTAGAASAYDDTFGQYGLIRMERLDDFIVTLNAFDNLPLPLGGRVSVLTNAEGPGMYALDCLSNVEGLELARFSPATRTMLSSMLPPEASVGRHAGHVAMTGGVSAKMTAQAVATALRDPGVDAVLHVFVPTSVTSADEVARELLRLLPGIKRHGLDKPYFPVLLGGQTVAAARKHLEEKGLVTFGSPDQAAAALAAMVRYGVNRQPPGMEAAVDGR